MKVIARHDRIALRTMRARVTAVSLLAIIVLLTPGWTEQAWGQSNVRRVGILSFSAATSDPNLEVVLTVFRRELANRGWVEGQNVAFEYQNAGSDPSRFSAAAVRLVERDVDVIFATSAPALRAAYAATRTVPIVAGDFTTDPVAEGYVESYARPGGNVTGIFLDAPEFAGKWFEFLKAMIPDMTRIAVLWDPGPGDTHLQAIRSVAQLLELELQVIDVRKPDDLDQAFAALHSDPQALILLPSPLIYNQSTHLAKLALEHRLPATSMAHSFANAGGTLAYGPDRASTWERGAVFVARILSGSKPGEMPVERPTKIQLVVNLNTARILGLSVPQSILLRADEVIR